MSKKFKPSAHFVDLLSLYLSEVGDMGVDSSGTSKKALDRHIAERRTSFSTIVPLLGSNPEMGAVVFYGMKVEATMARQILTAEVDDLPSWEVAQPDVTLPKGTEGLVTQVEDKSFLVIAAGLEWARQNQKLITN